MHAMKMMTAVLLTVGIGCTELFAQSSEKGSDKKAGSASKTTDFTKGPGIEIGKELPEIKLKNQAGEEVSVHELLKSQNVALVFYRSASW